MRKFAVLALLVPFALACAEEPLPKLYPGAKAPKLEVAEWVKNGPMKLGKGIKVVEFWATWCGPCRQTIPHLTELAKKYKGKVEFAGVSIWEREKTLAEIKPKIAKFVADMGDKMDYHVAYDTEDKKMAQNWMAAAEQNGIPSSFIVDNKGVVLWIGHPANIEEPLQKAIEGKLDVKAELAEFMKKNTTQRESAKIQKDVQAALALIKEGKTAEADQALSVIASKSAQGAAIAKQIRLTQLYKPGTPESQKLVDSLIAGNAEDQTLVAQFALRQSSSETGKDIAKSIVQTLAPKAEDCIVLYYCAVAAKNVGDKALAVQAVDKALVALDKDERKSMLEGQGFRKALDGMKAELAK